jgi:hypothetical protein
VLALPFVAISQETTEFKKQRIISLVPQYVFQNGFRFDYELTLKDNWKSWLQISPTIFLSNDDSDITSYSYNSMKGIGLEVHHKYFMKEPDERKGFYFAYGGGYQLLGIKSDQFVSYSYFENGNEYISFREEETTTAINRFLLNIVVGKQIVRYKPFIIDYYFGVGFRYSMDKNFNMIENFNDSWFDYGYSGSILVAGLKFGFNFEK